MKRNQLIGLCLGLLMSLSMVGCVCYPGGYSSFASPLGCAGPGVVDYVNGGNCTAEADCGSPCGAVSCAPTFGCSPCGVAYPGCFGNLGTGICALGEGVLDLAATPFILVGNVLCGGSCGYQEFQGCGCSSEVYYGDNCYQPHDFNDPCTGNGCNSCGGTVIGSTGCSRCSGGYMEGVQFSQNTRTQNVQTQPRMLPSRPVAQASPKMFPTRTYRPITQASYQQSYQPYQQQVVQPGTRFVPPQR